MAEEFSFPSLTSHDIPHHSGLDSPPLWQPSPEHSRRKDYEFDFPRFLIRKDDDHDQTKSFSYVETRTRWIKDKEEEKMDMLWEDLNEELPPRSQSLRIEPEGNKGEKKTDLFSDQTSVVSVGCRMKLTKNTHKKKKKILNVLVLMRVLKKLIILRRSSQSQRSPVKTHPR